MISSGSLRYAAVNLTFSFTLFRLWGTAWIGILNTVERFCMQDNVLMSWAQGCQLITLKGKTLIAECCTTPFAGRIVRRCWSPLLKRWVVVTIVRVFSIGALIPSSHWWSIQWMVILMCTFLFRSAAKVWMLTAPTRLGGNKCTTSHLQGNQCSTWGTCHT
jgi:hypothetical protein